MLPLLLFPLLLLPLLPLLLLLLFPFTVPDGSVELILISFNSASWFFLSFSISSLISLIDNYMREGKEKRGNKSRREWGRMEEKWERKCGQEFR